jgi:hypothetical protein
MPATLENNPLLHFSACNQNKCIGQSILLSFDGRGGIKKHRVRIFRQPSTNIFHTEIRHENYHHLLLAMKLSAPGFQAGSRTEETIRRRGCAYSRFRRHL